MPRPSPYRVSPETSQDSFPRPPRFNHRTLIRLIPVLLGKGSIELSPTFTDRSEMDQHMCELPPDPLPQEVWLELDRLKWRCPECGLRWRFFSFDGSSEDERPAPLWTTRGQWRPVAKPVSRPAAPREWFPREEGYRA